LIHLELKPKLLELSKAKSKAKNKAKSKAQSRAESKAKSKAKSKATSKAKRKAKSRKQKAKSQNQTSPLEVGNGEQSPPRHSGPSINVTHAHSLHETKRNAAQSA
jgi:FKBP-type peptidyl-prolyl cis-trans isomerase